MKIKNLIQIALVPLIGSSLSVLAEDSPYIYKVYEYRPAPGQFINVLPPYEEGDDENEMALKAEEYLADNAQMLVSLGGWGGYVVFGFDHTVTNVAGEYDFKILGNAFYAAANPNPDAPTEGGSCEQGIVLVSRDINGNGRPDDPWYELAGSEFHSEKTKHGYECTYYRPADDKVAEPNENYTYIDDMTYIRWTDNFGDSGYVEKNVFHDQSYWPLWLDRDELTFSGERLADNWVDESGNGSYYVLYSYPWGYVDNHPNSDERSNFKIDWAVDSDGNPVELDGVDFIKVYTGVNQTCGWLGETSTEVTGAIDLHVGSAGVTATGIKLERRVTLVDGGRIALTGFAPGERVAIYDIAGSAAGVITASGESCQIVDAPVHPGVYIAKTDRNAFKIRIK